MNLMNMMILMKMLMNKKTTVSLVINDLIMYAALVIHY